MNGPERMEYPNPLYGDTADALRQLRAYLFKMADTINRVISKVEDLESTQQEGQNGGNN